MGQSTQLRYWSDVVDGFPLPTTNFRMRERLFSGAAVGLPNTRGDSGTWDTGYGPSYLERDGQTVSMSDNGGPALVGMTQTAGHSGITNPPAAIGVSAFATNNSIVRDDAFAFYGEAFFDSTDASGTGVAQIAEYDVRNSTAFDHPGYPYGQGAGAEGLRINAGGDTSYGPPIVSPSNFAIGIDGFNSTFHTGIIFGSASLTPDGGGIGAAISMAQNQALNWYSTGGLQKFRIYSTLGASDTNWRIIADNQVINIRGNGDIPALAIQQIGSAARWPVLKNAVAGGAPGITVDGAADVDLSLLPAGAGLISIGNAASYSANASVATVLGSIGPAGSHTTVQKWLTIKDNTGATLYIPAF
jgi:hypothetical protein